MLIHINRKIFNALSGTEEQLEYVIENVTNTLETYIDNSDDFVVDVVSNFIDYKEISKNIQHVIFRNEKTISEIGLSNYYHNNMTADQYVSGYYYASGRIVICPFDWSMNNETDENWSYSFTLAITL